MPYALLGTLVAAILLLYWSRLIVYIPNDKIGIKEKLWSLSGSLTSGFIALNGEAGYQADVLRGGFHLLFPFQYRIHFAALVTVPQGQLAYVYARDGKPLAPSQVLASNIQANNFENVRAFLEGGGQKGPQRMLLREGVFAINIAQFIVMTQDHTYHLDLTSADKAMIEDMSNVIKTRKGFTPVVISGSDDSIGVVTCHDGPSLAQGEIIAAVVGSDPVHDNTFHNCFQDPEKFLAAGGNRGRQLQILVDGSYYINRLFATVELIPKTLVEVGSVGVIVSYAGQRGVDTTSAEYQHGELVENGRRGVWADPFLPGKYAFNTFAGAVKPVPTTNFILKWDSRSSGSTFDANLKEVTLITKDAFEPLLPLSVVVNIPYTLAPMVIQRFGDIQRLVEQTLDPMVSAYFKNIAQKFTLIELLQQRDRILEQALTDMRERFKKYNLELHEVLLGTPRSSETDKQIETMLAQLRDRQVAVEKVETFKRQSIAAEQERDLNEAIAKAKQQTTLTESAIQIDIANNNGVAKVRAAEQRKAEMIQLAEGESQRIRIEAEAHGQQIERLGKAESEKIKMTGEAAAQAAKAQVEAFGGAEIRLRQELGIKLTEAIRDGKIALVPQVMVGADSGGNATGAFTGLLAAMTGERSSAMASAPALT